MKIRFFDKHVRKCFAEVAMWILTIFSVMALFLDFDDDHKWWILACLVLVLALAYVIVWIYANKIKKIEIKIRNTNIIIKEGDLFTEPGKKLIPCNEYFDTQVDDKVIATKSLQGIFIQRYIADLSDLDNYINNVCATNKVSVIDQSRQVGRKTSFKLGTIIPYQDYLLLAYSRFDCDNRAFLGKDDFALCYTNMWNEIDIVRSGDSISVPVLGSGGMVRFYKDYTTQELIEIILWSFKISGINLAKQATLNVIVHESSMDEINFWRLKDYSD